MSPKEQAKPQTVLGVKPSLSEDVRLSLDGKSVTAWRHLPRFLPYPCCHILSDLRNWKIVWHHATTSRILTLAVILFLVVRFILIAGSRLWTRISNTQELTPNKGNLHLDAQEPFTPFIVGFAEQGGSLSSSSCRHHPYSLWIQLSSVS